MKKHQSKMSSHPLAFRTCFNTPPLASVNCSWAHDGLRTMLQPSLKPHRYQPLEVVAASHAAGVDMESEGR
jgi:hypothetical protein